MEKFVNPIDDVFKQINLNSNEKNQILFESGDDEIDLRTDLKYPEDVFASSLFYTDDFLINHGLKPIYSVYLKDLLRKRVSLDRQSRTEFVNVNKKDFVNDDLMKLGSINNLMDVRK